MEDKFHHTGKLVAVPMGYTAETHQATFNFAHMTVQIKTSSDVHSHPSEKKPATTTENLGKPLLALAAVPDHPKGSRYTSPMQRPPNLHGITAVTKEQLLDAQTQVEAACRDKCLTKMLMGVITNIYCLAWRQAWSRISTQQSIHVFYSQGSWVVSTTS